jgi:hypothetical protein
MKRTSVFCILLMIVLASLLVVPAALAETESADPGGEHELDPDANACYEGGTLAGQCHSDADWSAGWFLVRYEHGEMDRERIPGEYHGYLPRPVETHNNDSKKNSKDKSTDDEICLEPEEPERHG